jgi:hypothetical protein
VGATPNLKFGAFSESRNHRFVNRGVTQVAVAHMIKKADVFEAPSRFNDDPESGCLADLENGSVANLPVRPVIVERFQPPVF